MSHDTANSIKGIRDRRLVDGVQSVRLPGTPTCPGCGEVVDGASYKGPAPDPRPGDLSVCLHCAAVSVITDAGTFRPITDPERAQLQAVEPAVWRQLQAWVAGIERQRRNRN